MNFFERIQLFIAIHREARINYHALNDLEETLQRHGLMNAEDVGNAAYAVNAELRRRALNAAIEGVKLAVAETVMVAAAEKVVEYRGALQTIVDEGTAVAKPNGTTKKLVRIADEALSPPVSTDTVAGETDSARYQSGQSLDSLKPVQESSTAAA